MKGALVALYLTDIFAAFVTYKVFGKFVEVSHMPGMGDLYYWAFSLCATLTATLFALMLIIAVCMLFARAMKNCR